MKTIFHSENERGGGEYGWLSTRYSFSFNTWYNEDKMGFGALRVLNDDVIAPGQGFGRHGHRDMEIITVVMRGAVAHQDSIGNSYVVHEGDVQVMSAGTGVMHSEQNHSTSGALELFQLWIQPKVLSITPRYEQKNYDFKSVKNSLIELVGKDSLVINQDAYISYGSLLPQASYIYTLHDQHNGVYLFVIDGSVIVDGKTLNKRDALGLWETSTVTLEGKGTATFLVIEVPME